MRNGEDVEWEASSLQMACDRAAKEALPKGESQDCIKFLGGQGSWERKVGK